MPIQRMKKLLDDQGVHYVTLRHSPAHTAQAVAASVHIPSKEMAKTVMIRVDGQTAMAVLPASYQVDFDRLRDSLEAARVSLMPEKEFRGPAPFMVTSDGNNQQICKVIPHQNAAQPHSGRNLCTHREYPAHCFRRSSPSFRWARTWPAFATVRIQRPGR